MSYLKIKADVYWNLHKKCWSIRHKGKVVGHAKSITMSDVTFVVQPAGRARVLREKKKNVHAFARGIARVSFDTFMTPNNDYNWQTVTYNPYKDETFVRCVYNGHDVSRIPVSHARELLMTYSPVTETPKVYMLVGDE